jgi:transcriptional regulator with XRE-family HTH domain
MRIKRQTEFGKRLSEKLGEMSLKDFASRIGVSYEMARRYSKGWAIPHDLQKLSLIAGALNTTVGYLLADEWGISALPLIDGKFSKPIKKPSRILITDEAMTSNHEGLVFFGVGDQVCIYPSPVRAGDVVAIKGRDGGITLRRAIDTPSGLTYAPRHPAHATYPATTVVVGVVGQAYGRAQRLFQ